MSASLRRKNPNNSPTALALAGGGIDSSLCMQMLSLRGISARAVHIDFGQKSANLEWEAVQRISKYLGNSSCQLRVQGLGPFELGEVRGRNAAFIFIALMHLLPNEDTICIGIHSGTPFYDCSAAFLEGITKVVAEYCDGRVRLIAPLLQYSKPEIVQLARSSQLPLHMTYSCQQGVVGGCGVCNSCKDREALAC